MAEPRQNPDFELERRLHREGYRLVAGLDEVGRGTLAGPVAAGAVVLSHRPSRKLFGLVRDSKQMTPQQREAAYEVITDAADACAVGWATAAEIDRIGIVPSVRLAMRRALDRLPISPDHLLIDAIPLGAVNVPQRSIVRGDSKSLSIAAASVIAKVERDRFMVELDSSFPNYGFESHKGYATRSHIEAVRRLGPCAQHRMSFQPVRHESHRFRRASPPESGRWAEEFVTAALEERGMEVVSRNFRSRFGEVDLITLDGGTLCFIEVRARRSSAFGSPGETISSPKARRIIAACNEYLQWTEIEWSHWRIDVAEVQLDRWGRPIAVEIIESAIEG